MDKKEPARKQHYVPQFYLRQWCDKDGGFYPVKVENKEPPNLRIFDNKSNPSRFCYENYFYAQHTGEKDETSQEIEKSFAEVEAIFSKELPKLEKKILNNEQITDEDKWHLSECALFLHFRGKNYRNESRRIFEEMFKKTNELLMPHKIETDKGLQKEMANRNITKDELLDFVNKGEYSVEFNNLHHLRIMKDINGFCNLLKAKYWLVYISRNGDFITTDSPYLDRPLSDSFWGNDFLSREQVFILSPRVVIVARYPNDMNGKKFKRQDITNDRGRIHTINSLTLMNSISFGFHKDKNLLTELNKFTNYFYQYKKTKS